MLASCGDIRRSDVQPAAIGCAKLCRYRPPARINKRCALRHSVEHADLPFCAQRRHDDAHLSYCCRDGSWFGCRVGRSGAVRGLKSATTRWWRACMWSRAMWRGWPRRCTTFRPRIGGKRPRSGARSWRSLPRGRRPSREAFHRSTSAPPASPVGIALAERASFTSRPAGKPSGKTCYYVLDVMLCD